MTDDEHDDEPKTLIGSYFHSVDHDGYINWHGVVLSSPEPGIYLVQLFDWLMGHNSNRYLMTIDAMHDWLFYRTADEMNHSYKHGVAREGGPFRRRKTS